MFALEKVDDPLGGLLDARILRVDDEVGLGRHVVSLIDAREALDDTLTRLLVETLDVATLAHLERRLNEHLEERQIGVRVDLAGHPSVRRERRHEATERDHAGVGEESRDFGDTTHVLLAVLFTEAEVTVQTGAYVVTVQAIRGDSLEHREFVV